MNQPTKKQIEEWKAVYGTIYELEFDDKACIIFDPTSSLAVMKAAISAMQKGSVTKFTETVLRNCFLHGDKEILEQDKYINGLEQQVAEISEMPEPDVEQVADSFAVTVDNVTLHFAKASRHDLKKAERKNPQMLPFKTQEALLMALAKDGERLLDIRKNNERLFLGFLLAADELKDKSSVSIKKL